MASSALKRKRARQLERWDKTYLWHPFTQHAVWDQTTPLIIDSGQGIYLKDVYGKKYIDGVSSLWVNLWGHGHPALNRALQKQLKKISHSTFLGLTHPPAIELGKELARLAPAGLTRTFYSDNGATAVEVALKMSFQYWMEKEGQGTQARRKEFLAIRGSYHGDTIGSVSVGSIGNFHGKFKSLLFKTHFAMSPNCSACPLNKTKNSHRYRCGEKVNRMPRLGSRRPETGCRWECLGDVERILKKKSKSIAAIVIEPIVQGATGMIVMPPGYLKGIQGLARKYNVHLIVDEVATAFGRTGTLFACEQENVSPDFLCLAKALTGGYSPLAATMTTEKIYKAFYGPIEKGRTFFHGHSYTAHPLGAALAVANLKLIRNTKLLEKSRHLAHLMKEELEPIAALKPVKSVRQAGLMVGIELQAAARAAKICKMLLNQGIWIRPLGPTLVVMPPLIISKSQLRALVRKLKKNILHEQRQ